MYLRKQILVEDSLQHYNLLFTPCAEVPQVVDKMERRLVTHKNNNPNPILSYWHCISKPLRGVK